MPYIPQENRKGRVYAGEMSVGELNYYLTRFLDTWLGDDICYAKLMAVIGTLECVKQEFYRRVAAPYEDRKMAENGDVYRERT